MTINMPCIVVRQTVQWRDADFSSRKARTLLHTGHTKYVPCPTLTRAIWVPI
jgi:hypothetical protein